MYNSSMPLFPRSTFLSCPIFWSPLNTHTCGNKINSDENVGLVKARGKELIFNWKLNEIRST